MKHNRLIHEKSPYLLQHAESPVDWYPWGEDAFKAARESDKPIFLSIGYATCHWCHVMERETFSDPQIAAKMNELFINIKVDREELPAIDALYMEFAQAMMQGRGGWPLNLILTPTQEPVFAATYIPPVSKPGFLGMNDLLLRLTSLWKDAEELGVLQQAKSLVEQIRELKIYSGPDLPPKELIDQGADLLFHLADPVHGGLKGTPKFPIPYLDLFFLIYTQVTRDGRGAFQAHKTLDHMAAGGIHDQLIGGFCRYTIDEEWLVPHFEKMLYDNALLLETYAKAYTLTHNPLYKEVGLKIIDYVSSSMTSSKGCYYSAEDSETRGEEGHFYTWLYSDITNILGSDSALFCSHYGITPKGNFHGRNILSIKKDFKTLSEETGLSVDEIKKKIVNSRYLLQKIRETGDRPFCDRKVITSWNGLMIHALVTAGTVFQQPELIQLGKKAADALLSSHIENDLLYRYSINGEKEKQGTLEDYANLIRALITLFESGSGSDYLKKAITLCARLKNDFKIQDGAYAQIAHDDSSLILQNITFADGSEPSGNALQTENLLRLYSLTNDSSYLQDAEDVLKGAYTLMKSYPPGYTYHLMNLIRYYANAPTLVIALDDNESHKSELARCLNPSSNLLKSVIWRQNNDTLLFEALPFVKEQVPQNGLTTLYICFKGVCEHPLTDLNEMKKKIAEL